MTRALTSVSSSILAETPRELTDKQRAFVDAYLTSGGSSAQAAIAAGYAPDHADSNAARLTRNPAVQHAIMRGVIERIGLQAVPALHVIERLSSSSRSDYVKLEAARDLLDRAGFSARSRIDQRLDASLTVELNLTAPGERQGGSETGRSDLVTPLSTRNFDQKDVIEVAFSTVLPDDRFPWE